jgi:hypothetical protein
MTGKTSIKRATLQTSAVEAAIAKHALGMRRAVVPAGGGKEIVAKTGGKGTAYAGKLQLQIRKMGRTGPTETSGRAKALKGCKGKRGCDFVDCVKDAMGRVPTNLAKACPTRA